MQDFIDDVAVTHGLEATGRVGEVGIGARVVEAVESLFIADVQFFGEHQDDACLLAPAYGISHRASGVKSHRASGVKWMDSTNWRQRSMTN